jgi:trigger factor
MKSTYRRTFLSGNPSSATCWQNGRTVKTRVEELPENRVRLEVEVPSDHMKHAVEHASSDLAASTKIPGFRKGKVPQRVLEARVGRDRIFSEAVESHIGGWFWNAAEDANVRPVSQPELNYELPTSEEEPFSFTAEVAVQPPPEVADWSGLEVPSAESDVPAELVERELEALRASVAELVPVEDRPARDGDVLVADLVDEGGEAQRDYVVQLGAGRLVEEIERGLRGMSVGETKKITYTDPEGQQKEAEATLKEIKEPVLPPLDDELARSASEFETLEELRTEIESRLHEAIQAELEADFRAAAVDKLIEASKVDVSDSLVESRAAELLSAMLRSLESRGLDAETYLRVTGQSADQLRDTLRGEARRAISRELVLEAVADKLGVEVSDDELKDLVREQAEAAGEDPDAVTEQLWQTGRHERLRADLRLKKALDKIVEDVKPIPVELARARESIWTPEKEKPETAAKLWTPGSSKEPA